MNSKLQKLTLTKLYELKTIVLDMINELNKELNTYNFIHNDEYITKYATEHEKSVLKKRLKLNELYNNITCLIDEKIKEFYD